MLSTHQQWPCRVWVFNAAKQHKSSQSLACCCYRQTGAKPQLLAQKAQTQHGQLLEVCRFSEAPFSMSTSLAGWYCMSCTSLVQPWMSWMILNPGEGHCCLMFYARHTSVASFALKKAQGPSVSKTAKANERSLLRGMKVTQTLCCTQYSHGFDLHLLICISSKELQPVRLVPTCRLLEAL